MALASYTKFFLPWCFAPLLPVVLPFTRSPDSSFYNTLSAVFGWGVVLLFTGRLVTSSLKARSLFFFLMLGGVLGGAMLWCDGARVLVLAGVLGLLGSVVARHPNLQAPALDGLFAGYVLAGFVAWVICAVQFFWPAWANGTWVAASPVLGRAVGNLRQPNLQATMLIWGAVAAAWLAVRQAALQRAFPLLLTGMMFSVALTGSRTGMVLTGLLMLWGLLDRQLPRIVRITLGTAPLNLLVSFILLSVWAHQMGGSYFAETRAQASGDISSSRFAIWANTLEIIHSSPWGGVGWGNFNFAWTLTDFERRPTAFFDHAHNLLLQLAVELGIPATVALCGLFLWSGWKARGALSKPDPLQQGAARVALVMLAAVLFHSLLEYPLWYSYFLLPSTFLWGLYLGLGWPGGRSRPSTEVELAGQMGGKTHDRLFGQVLLAAGLVMIVGTFYAAWDYQRITQIFAPDSVARAQPLAERIREGQHSRLFGVHADYAAVTTAPRPAEVFSDFERPLHRLIDARLMVAYARALAERGERTKAVYIAQRLREFRHPLGDQFFAVCGAPAATGVVPPFQCEMAPVRLTYRDLEP